MVEHRLFAYWSTGAVLGAGLQVFGVYEFDMNLPPSELIAPDLTWVVSHHISTKYESSMFSKLIIQVSCHYQQLDSRNNITGSLGGTSPPHHAWVPGALLRERKLGKITSAPKPPILMQDLRRYADQLRCRKSASGSKVSAIRFPVDGNMEIGNGHTLICDCRVGQVLIVWSDYCSW